MRVLIVEDEKKLADALVQIFTKEKITADAFYNGVDGLDNALTEIYDVILLDVMLPEMDGITVLKEIRKAGLSTPVIMLTARDALTDKVKGLRLGAEDYIVKPFEALELLARIDVVLRRSHKTHEMLTYRDIAIDTSRHTITKAGEPVQLTPKEFDVIVYFLQHQDIAVSRERLLSAVWGYEFGGESRTVDIHVQQVRRKLDLKECLITIPKLGYRLESEELS